MSNLSDEKNIYLFWEKNNFFNADLKSFKKPFSLLMPPPNLTGELHLGHAMQHSILDAVARFKRMQGFDVLLLPGVDHAGIQFESTFEKYLAKQNLSKQKLGREKWLKKAWEFKDEIYKKVSGSWQMMGISADWSKEVFTLDEKCRKAVFAQFKTYFEKGMIYKGPYIVQWCPKDQTAIEDVEMEYEEKEETLYYVRYLIEGTKDEYIEIATARPETIFADTGIAVYKNHPKFKKFIGKKAQIPLGELIGLSIPIFEDERVEKDFGTGALKITPGHDLLDYEIGKDHNLVIQQVVGKDGRLTNLAGDHDKLFKTKSGAEVSGLSGIRVLDARKDAVKWLKANDALVKEESYVHSVAVCDRCKTVVEPLISEEWFVKTDELAKGAIEIIKKGKINFLPKNYAKILTDWLENIHDWCISRSLWWGHRIPVWYRGDEKEVSLESPGEDWKQDEQVLDTWFSSGLWPLSTLDWPNGDWEMVNGKWKLKNSYFPWDFEISAPEIKFLWIARMIMISSFFTGEVPFRTMFFHGMLRDLHGRKFSKSLGNGIEPEYLIKQWGVDATRMALYTYSIPGRDGKVSKQILDERGKNFRNFATKIRNIARYIYELKPDGNFIDSENSNDKIIKEKLVQTTQRVTKNLNNLELHLAVDELYNFIWHEFADIYLEKSKARRNEAQAVLELVFETCLKLLHPFMPFLTENLYQQYLNGEDSVMLEKWPSDYDIISR